MFLVPIGTRFLVPIINAYLHGSKNERKHSLINVYSGGGLHGRGVVPNGGQRRDARVALLAAVRSVRRNPKHVQWTHGDVWDGMDDNLFPNKNRPID